jgi:hypothetical protein
MQPVLALSASHKHKENDMGQFKPMVKMMTTEPSVELKLKKGGKVAKKADGGMMGSPMSAAGPMPPAMPARGGMPMMGRSPMKPSLAMRRRAMKGLPAGAGPAGPVGGAASMQPSMPASMAPPMAPPVMKKGGKADMPQDKAMIKKAFKQHDMQEHKGGKGTSLKLKHGGKMATGGVVNGQGGFATGGVVKGQGGYATGGVTKSNGGGYKEGGMTMVEKGGKMVPDFAADGKGKMKKGGKIKGMMGGGMMGEGMMDEGMMGDAMYKKGGSTKEAYAAGGTVNSGRPVAMPQGAKKPSQPVRTNLVVGTFKKGGKVTPAQGRLQKMSASENAPAFRAAKADSNEKYGPASRMKRAEGGNVDLSKGAYDKAIGPDEDDMAMAKSIRGFPGKVMGKVKSMAKDLFSTAPKADSVTKTKESVTVTPAGKKRGGSVKC